MEKVKLGLRSPWELHERKLWAMFRKDDEVDLDYNETERKYILRVKTAKKANALSQLMPTEVVFGNVTCRVCIVPANVGEVLPDDAPAIEIVRAAFEGNAAVEAIRPVSRGFFKDLCYVVFENCVVQYDADNIADVNGNVSTLYENIAREVFTKADGVFFCTTVRIGGVESNALDKPLGEWP